MSNLHYPDDCSITPTTLGFKPLNINCARAGIVQPCITDYVQESSSETLAVA